MSFNAIRYYYYRGGQGYSDPSLALISQVSQYGTLADAFVAGNTTNDDSKVSSWNGHNGNSALQATESSKFYLKKVVDKLCLYAPDDDRSAELATNPFSGITDGTLFVVYRPALNHQHILLGDGANTGYSWTALNSVSTSKDLAFGAPVYYRNGVLANWSTRLDVYNAVNTNTMQVITAKSIDLSTWARFNIGNYRGGLLGAPFKGEIAAVILFSDNLSDANRTAVEQILNDYAESFVFHSYTESFSTVVDDTDAGGNLANTGLAYDSVRDEILVAEFQETRGGRILIYDRATLSLTTAIDISAHQHTLQGIAHDDINDIYYVLGESVNGNDLKGYDRSGNVILEKDWNALGALGLQSSLCFYNGFLYFRPQNEGIYKISPSDLSVSEVIEINPVTALANIEGLYIDGTGYWLGEGGILRKWSLDGILMEEISGSASQPEGITVDNDGNVYINRDLFYHGGTAGGNRLYKYTRA